MSHHLCRHTGNSRIGKAAVFHSSGNVTDVGLRLGPEPRALYAETLYPRLHLGWSDLRSIVDGRWHLVEGPRPELYDLVADPGETRDLAAREPNRGQYPPGANR